MPISKKQQPRATAGADEYQFDTFIGTVSAVSDSRARARDGDDDDSMEDQPSHLTGYRSGGGLETHHNSDDEEDVVHGVVFDDGEGDGGLKLSRRTNRVLSSYQDYIRGIDAEASKGGLESGKASKRSLPGGAGHRDYRGSEELELLNSDCYSFRDFSRLNEEYATSNLYDRTSMDFTGRGSRNYRYHFLRSIKFRGLACSVLVGLIVLVLGKNASNENDLDADANTNTGLRRSDRIPSEKLEEATGKYPEGRPLNSKHEQNEIDDESELTKMLELYQPSFFGRTQWEGNTYGDALYFCASQDGLTLCPFEVACPLGVKSVRSGTIKLNAEQAFVPIWSESMRGEWVQIGPKNSCDKTHGELPESGGRSVMTGDLFCCHGAGDEDLSSTTESGEDYVEATATYDPPHVYANRDTVALHNAPMEFNRENGWNGETVRLACGHVYLSLSANSFLLLSLVS